MLHPEAIIFTRLGRNLPHHFRIFHESSGQPVPFLGLLRRRTVVGLLSKKKKKGKKKRARALRNALRKKVTYRGTRKSGALRGK